MKTFEQEMREFAIKTEKVMNTEISKFANISRKGYMGENVVMLDFKKTDFPAAKFVAEEIEKLNICRVNIYDTKNRVAMIF